MVQMSLQIVDEFPIHLGIDREPCVGYVVNSQIWNVCVDPPKHTHEEIRRSLIEAEDKRVFIWDYGQRFDRNFMWGRFDQSLRWGPPTLELINIPFTSWYFLRKVYMHRSFGGLPNIPMKKTAYTSTGRWAGSEHEYWFREQFSE